jgi:endonuclease/exonuclease/phosphatase family metal-dependent hydrolase
MLLRPEYRISAVTEHVRRLGADIVCLQEVEDSVFAALSAGLRELDFFGQFTKKIQGKPDGCATFIRTSSVGWIRSVPLFYDDAAQGQPSGHVAQIVVLKVDQRLLGIANTHLKWDPPNMPRDDQFGYRQISQLLQQRRILAPECSGWIICGDLNTTVDAAPIEALTKAAFDFTHRTWSGAATCNADRKARMIDYLFFDSSLHASALPLTEVTAETPLPSAEEPSDHVAVRAVFEWRTAVL